MTEVVEVASSTQAETAEIVATEASDIVANSDVQEGKEAPEEVGQEPDQDSVEAKLKSLLNAKTRDNRKIGKLHAQYAAERERAERLEQAVSELSKRIGPPEQQQAPSDTDPKYKSYGEFLDDKTKFTAEQIVEQKLAAFAKQQSEQQQQVAWVQEKTKSIDAAVESLKKTELPDYDNVLAPHEAAIAALPHATKLLALSLDNAALAAYQLAKEDAIDDLLYLPPAEAKIMLEQAAQRGLQAIAARKTTKAPQPMTPTKGAGSSGVKSLDRMTAQEIVKWVRG